MGWKLRTSHTLRHTQAHITSKTSYMQLTYPQPQANSSDIQPHTYPHTPSEMQLRACSHTIPTHTHTLPTFMYTLRRTTTHLQKCNSRHTVVQFCTHTHSCTPSDTQPHTPSWLCTTTLHGLNPTEAVTVTQFLHTHRNTHTLSLGHKTQTSDF